MIPKRTSLARAAIGRTLILVGASMAPFAGAGDASAQSVVRETRLPDEVAEAAEVRYNATSTIRVSGDFGIPAGGQIQGDLVVLEGTTEIAGILTGRLLVINGDLVVADGARLEGEVIVIGGDAALSPTAAYTGQVIIYSEPMRYRRRGTSLVAEVGTGDPVSPRFLASSVGSVRGHVTVRTLSNYNRVEGLPVLFGPVMETTGAKRLRLEGLGIWRTNEGFSLGDDKLGYRLRVDQALGGAGAYGIGLTFHSQVEAMESKGLTDLEASLATFFLHRDWRDYYDREGWSIYGRAAFPFTPAEFRVEYRDERHRFAPVGGPWSLTDNDSPWRPQPLIGAGDLQTLTAQLTQDSRNSDRTPTHGWMAQLGVTLGVDGKIALPAYSSSPVIGTAPEFAPTELETQFSKGWAELHWYSRVGPRAVFATHLKATGSIDGNRLPPQYQTSLGGEGSLPGFSLNHLDCGSRSTTGYIPHPDPEGEDDPVVPAFLGYGCDRAILAQIEYRSEFGGSVPLLGDGRFDGSSWLPPIDLTPGWTIFADFGRGWSLEENVVSAIDARNTGARTDVGAGLLLGGLGVYVAMPLEGDDREPNFFIRLAHRF